MKKEFAGESDSARAIGGYVIVAEALSRMFYF